MDITACKTTLERELHNELLDAAAKKMITLANIRTIAKEIIGDFDAINDESQLVAFLEKIKQKWPFFSNIFIKYKGEADQLKEKQVIDKLSNYLKKIN